MTSEDMNCGLTVGEREALRSALKALPETMPPREVWQRIERQARAEGLTRGRWLRHGRQWFSGAGIAAAVVLAVLVVLPRGESPPPTGDAAAELATVPEYADVGSGGQPADLELRTIGALMTRSRGLERDLRRLPASPALTRASTAAVIDELQRRIAIIDYRLNHPGVRMTRRQQELHWRERVRLMDSLVQLRYAQLQRGAF